jgi:hypothetical protein
MCSTYMEDKSAPVRGGQECAPVGGQECAPVGGQECVPIEGQGCVSGSQCSGSVIFCYGFGSSDLYF